MLNFDNSHDLDIVPWKGFLSFYPVENERAKVADAIQFMQAQKLAGYAPTGMDDLTAKLTKYKERLDYIDKQARAEAYRPLPNRDFVPKYRYMAPLKGAKEPGARALFRRRRPGRAQLREQCLRA
jgi:ABC-type Zn uptake system ZnuABC Zn-binding protein ZnuA